uniref:Uncharacterized protein n=1 Tax=Chromera velia CCMP2878 TaxID=1169474 RepID=A0A0G4G7B5_9ALVE|eukprot:Cvel_20605.t1-p1 / transcript=Cvel_20605.t1 / gene=Cvel_20605 / organism=Chromera_velia_CCMP2878 / gene_product=hypothetical protein / transcript_product=hypothetical protein / location=Cvel_scaffold1864:14021-21051(-) / protein_length=1583 / sequence_SO=supercontig / SO=protein_coding / is_pseudo=false
MQFPYFSLDELVQLGQEGRPVFFARLVETVNRRETLVREVAHSFISLLKSYGVEARQHGSWTQRIALPDSDCDISCPNDPNLEKTKEAVLQVQSRQEFVIQEEVSEWRLLIRGRHGVLLDVTQKAMHHTEPYHKAQHIVTSVNSAVDENVRLAVLVVKLWVRKHIQTFQPKDGYPNAYTFLLIFLFLCTHRQRPVIPLIKCLREETGEGVHLRNVKVESPPPRLFSEDPLVLFQEFLAFLVADLKNMPVEFERSERRPIPTSLSPEEQLRANKEWFVKEPFTRAMKCRSSGRWSPLWHAQIRPDIIQRAQADLDHLTQRAATHSPVQQQLRRSMNANAPEFRPSAFAVSSQTFPTRVHSSSSTTVPPDSERGSQGETVPATVLPPPPPPTDQRVTERPLVQNSQSRQLHDVAGNSMMHLPSPAHPSASASTSVLPPALPSPPNGHRAAFQQPHPAAATAPQRVLLEQEQQLQQREEAEEPQLPLQTQHLALQEKEDSGQQRWWAHYESEGSFTETPPECVSDSEEQPESPGSPETPPLQGQGVIQGLGLPPDDPDEDAVLLPSPHLGEETNVVQSASPLSPSLSQGPLPGGQGADSDSETDEEAQTVEPKLSSFGRGVWPVVSQPEVHTICLKGFSLGNTGFTELEVAISTVSLGSLRFLSLEDTGLDAYWLERICEAMKERGRRSEALQIETLILSRNDIGGGERDGDGCGMRALSSALNFASLPRLRVLILENCHFRHSPLPALGSILSRGELPRLETLDVGGVACGEFDSVGGDLESFVFNLRRDRVPSLKRLNLFTHRCLSIDCLDKVFACLSFLRSSESSPVEHVKLHLKDADHPVVRELAAGKFPFVRSLTVTLREKCPSTFLRSLRDGLEEPPKFELLHLNLMLCQSTENLNLQMAQEGMVRLTEAVEKGRLRGVRGLVLGRWEGSECMRGEGPPWKLLSENLFIEIRRFFESLCSPSETAPLPRLRRLSFCAFSLTDAHMTLFAKALRIGNLPGLREFEIKELPRWDVQASKKWGERGLERKGIETLVWEGLVTKQRGDAALRIEKIDLSGARVEGGGFPLAMALGQKSFERISCINLNCSFEGVGGLNDAALSMFASAVKTGVLLSLAELHLRGNHRITKESWAFFMHIVSESELGLPCLKVFDIRDTSVADSRSPGVIRDAAIQIMMRRPRGFLVLFVLSLFRGKLPSLESLGGPSPFGLYQDWVLEQAERERKEITGPEEEEAAQKAKTGDLREGPILPQLRALFSSAKRQEEILKIEFDVKAWELLESEDARIFFLTRLEAAMNPANTFDATEQKFQGLSTVAMERSRAVSPMATGLAALLDSLDLSPFKCVMRRWDLPKQPGGMRSSVDNDLFIHRVRVKPWGLAWAFAWGFPEGTAHYLYASWLTKESLTELLSSLVRALEEDSNREGHWLKNADSLRAKLETAGVWTREMTSLQAAVRVHGEVFRRASRIWTEEGGFGGALWGSAEESSSSSSASAQPEEKPEREGASDPSRSASVTNGDGKEESAGEPSRPVRTKRRGKTRGRVNPPGDKKKTTPTPTASASKSQSVKQGTVAGRLNQKAPGANPKK